MIDISQLTNFRYAEKTFPALSSLFACYFHEDAEVRTYDAYTETVEEALIGNHSRPEQRAKVIEEIERLEQEQLSEEELFSVLLYGFVARSIWNMQEALNTDKTSVVLRDIKERFEKCTLNGNKSVLPRSGS